MRRPSEILMKKSPLQIVKERFKDKAGLVAAVQALATDDLWLDRLSEDEGLELVSNAKLLHLHEVLTSLKSEFGSRKALIDAILKVEGRDKDADYRTRFEGWSTPRLWDYYGAKKKGQKSN
jgi:hypothetical protein